MKTTWRIAALAAGLALGPSGLTLANASASTTGSRSTEFPDFTLHPA